MAQATEETRIYAIASSLEEFYNQCSYPVDLLGSDKFQEGVLLLSSASFSVDDLLSYYAGTSFLVSCMALEALARRRDTVDLFEPILLSINFTHWWTRYFALRTLHELFKRDIITPLLVRLDTSWNDYTLLGYLREFIRRRLSGGEHPVWDGRLEQLTETEIQTLGDLVNNLTDSLPAALVEDFNNWRGDPVDTSFLNSIGRVWEKEEKTGDETVIMLDIVSDKVAELETALRKETPRSVMVVGDSGVGKTSLIRVLARRLQEKRWTIFEASATDIMAGQKYTGELEGRVQSLVRQIQGKRALWIVPHFQELLWAGRHTQSPVGVLDMLLPYIERGEIKLIGETSAQAYEKLLILKPKLRTALETCRVEPLSDNETLELARQWVQRQSAKGAGANLSEQTLLEAFQLAKQFLADKAAPGNLLHLLELTEQRLAVGKGALSLDAQISLDDLLVTLSQLTGLPASILDDRAALDISDLHKFFAERVLGQPEAVECLIERVAMIKAGLTDPTRPSGVFLFVGPTGTGKTEIAKTLAAFLFGSPDRMIRLDMSEFKTADSLDRILGESGALSESTALVNAIRKQPFSVVLLDEFEKASSSIWDLFLQVFDDGRLTDRRGNTADFRHSIIIMTSNLGATLPHGASIGFMQLARDQEQFAANNVEHAVGQAFRREFVNRIDRIVVFRPLGWSVMRELLQKELKDVLLRRGFRNRQWAVEWDESAIEFLLQKGFTADLGARPLKRAIERYLLSPLAMTIVNHQFPEGDQFLFVRSDGTSVVVEFIDPDALDKREEEAKETEPAAAAQEESEELRLKEIVMDGRGTPAEVSFLQNAYEQLAERVGDEEWRERKHKALLQTTRPDFWDSPERFSVLGLAEYMDRIEAGLETAGSLLQRISRIIAQPAGRKQFPRELVLRVAQHLYLLDAACTGLAQSEPRDAFISIKGTRDTVADREFSDAFAQRLAAMYKLWAEKRGMRFDILEETHGDFSTPYHFMLAVSGFGAYSILQHESGLHVLEMIEDGKQFNRIKVHVRIAPQPDEPPAHGEDPRTQASHTFLAQDPNEHKTIRRYREEPSPLVRDTVRHWRTGKLERVLGGDFDLIA